MKTRTITQSAILLAIGTILHMIPGFVNMIKPDFMLVSVFTIILINKDIKISMIAGFAGGLLAGFTTSAVGGFLPNVVDKIIASLFVYILSKVMGEKISRKIFYKGLLYFLGTLVSGFIFLLFMDIAGSIPAGFGLIAMFVSLVIPTAILNIVVGLFFFNIIKRYDKILW